MPWASKTTDAAVYKCQPNDVAKKTRKHKIRAARSQNAGKFQAKKWLKYADSESMHGSFCKHRRTQLSDSFAIRNRKWTWYFCLLIFGGSLFKWKSTEWKRSANDENKILLKLQWLMKHAIWFWFLPENSENKFRSGAIFALNFWFSFRKWIL